MLTMNIIAYSLTFCCLLFPSKGVSALHLGTPGQPHVPPAAEKHDGVAFGSITNMPLEKVRYILVAVHAGHHGNDNEYSEVEKAVLIEDTNIVQAVFKKLKSAPLVAGRDLLLVPGRAVIFLDDNKDVTCGFLYWNASRPRGMFKRHAATKRDGKYYFGKEICPDVILEKNQNGGLLVKDARCVADFEDYASKYLDLYK